MAISRFRATGDVQLWDPATGTSKPAGMLRREGETTAVSLDLAPSESVFVMFRPSTEKPTDRIVRVERDGAMVAEMRVPADAGKPVRAAYYGDPANACAPQGRHRPCPRGTCSGGNPPDCEQ